MHARVRMQAAHRNAGGAAYTEERMSAPTRPVDTRKAQWEREVLEPTLRKAPVMLV